MKFTIPIPPMEFVSPLSEVEVRMTLRELCGSRWDNYPFHGEVDKNSFRLTKNQRPFTYTRGSLKPILKGNFVEQDGKTKVTISLHTRMIETIGVLIGFLVILVLAGYAFVGMLDEGVMVAIASAMIIYGFAVLGFAISYFWIWSSFHRCATKIKKALGSIP